MQNETVDLSNVKVTPVIEGPDEDGHYTVWFHWSCPGVVLDITCNHGIQTRTLALAKRLARATEAGVIFSEIRFARTTPESGSKSYITGRSAVMGKYLNADLRRMGF